MRRLSLLVTLVSTAIFISACSKPAPPPRAEIVQPVKVIRIGSDQTSLVREFPGVVRASQRVDLAFQVPGQLVKFNMKEGQQVKVGDFLGEIDKTDYQASFDAARAQLNSAQANFDRAQELIKENFISQSDLDRLTSNLELSRSNFSKAEKALKDTRLLAPFSGSVARTYVENFEDVLAKQTILSLQDNNNLEIVVDVSETLVARRNPGADLSLKARFESFAEREFDVILKEFSTEANPSTQTFQLVLGLMDTQGTNILPGMTALVHAELKGNASELAIKCH